MSISARSIASPNYALEDHWRAGIARMIRDFEPDIVLMQQGPSSLPGNQLNLAQWSGVLAEVIREVGAEPGLLMVWPGLARASYFPAVLDSYRNAALGIDGRFVPAGEALRRAHDDLGQAPFGLDGFHPSVLGSVIAALSILHSLNPDVLTDLPGEIESSSSGTPSMQLNSRKDAVFAVVQAVAEEYGFQATAP